MIRGRGLIVAAMLLCTLASCGPEKHTMDQIQWVPFSQVGPTFPRAPMPLFLYVSEDNCSHCRYMDSVVFKRPEIAWFINENFLPTSINVSRDLPVHFGTLEVDHAKLYRYLSIDGTPSYYFFDTSGQVLGALNSEMNILTFKRTLLYVRNGHFFKTPYQEWLKLPEAQLDTVYGLF